MSFIAWKFKAWGRPAGGVSRRQPRVTPLKLPPKEPIKLKIEPIFSFVPSISILITAQKPFNSFTSNVSSFSPPSLLTITPLEPGISLAYNQTRADEEESLTELIGILDL